MTMRCSLIVPVMALLFGAAPALAQEGNAPAGAEPARTQTKAPSGHPTRPTARHKTAAQSAVTATRRKPSVPLPRPDPTKTVAKAEPGKAAPDKGNSPPASGPIAAPAAAHTAMAADERLRIEAALTWTGDVPAAANGEDRFGLAVKNFQRRTNARATGELTPEQRTALLAAARQHENEFGWRLVTDPATGIRFGLPAKLLPRTSEAAHGTRWSSTHGEFRIETFRIKAPAPKLAELFEYEKTHPTDRRVETSQLRDDGFLIGGTQGLKNFSVRAQARGGELRGFTMMYDQAWDGMLAPVTTAMLNAFVPFPEHAAPYVAPTRPVEYGTGLIVSPQGHIVTSRRLTEGCRIIAAVGLGDAERVAADDRTGLALLRVYGQSGLAAVPLAREAPDSGEVTLVGVPDPREQSDDRRTQIKARSTDDGMIVPHGAAPIAGLIGAAVVDSRGRVIGMMDIRGTMLASLDASPSPARLVPSGAIVNFLAAHRVPTVADTGGEAPAAVTRVICVRDG
ncbi:MAG: trypsin-like peptidase domain-containing protein [Pseudolabrys sp.]|nr:trypsin-like peptidase domain-containing protein [Pseudolabrys sp.]